MFRHGQRGEKLGNPLYSAVPLELFNLLNEIMHVLGDRCDHRQCNIGTVVNAPDKMVGRNTSNTRFAYRFCGRDITVPGECNRLREAIAFCHDLNDSFIAEGVLR